MNFQPSGDHDALMDAVDKLVAREHARWTAAPVRCDYAPQLQQQIEDTGFLGAMGIDELGPVAAAGVVMALARLPVALELLASAFVAPLVCPEQPGPCVLMASQERVPLRFATVARTAIRIDAATDTVHVATLAPADAEAVDSVFAYPMGVLRAPHALAWRQVPGVQAAQVQRLWRTGLAAEMVGCLAAGLDSVLAHVKDRRQFGRPLGSFQAVQHRLAECASLIESARWLALKAAGTGTTADSLLAAGFAQSIATRVAYDLHQFMGAMGLTLEHPLHRWTYRSKLLRSELMAAASHFALLADAEWGHGPRDATHPTKVNP